MAPARFTLEEYRGHLALALACGYRFIGFEDLDAAPDGEGAEILLRHDVDYAPKYMPQMAAIEAELGIRSTYCVHVDSRWYSIEEPANRAAIAATLDAGHWLGLHFDASAIASDRAARDGVVEQAQRLGRAFSCAVRVVSFHMPGRRRVEHLKLPDGLVNTYDARFFVEIGYVSDSNQHWRGVDLAEVLRGRVHDRLQLLIHPFWWRAQPATMRSKLTALADELGVDAAEIVTPEQLALMEEEDAAS